MITVFEHMGAVRERSALSTRSFPRIPGKTTRPINLSAQVLTVESSEAGRPAPNLLSVWL